jgi:dipeptidyl-peptidase-4
MQGKLIKQLTSGKWEVASYLGLDEKAGNLYFTSTETGAINRQLYVMNIRSGKKRQITQGTGVHDVNLSTDFGYVLDEYSTANSPSVYSLLETATGKTIKVLEDNKALKERLATYQVSPAEFFTFKTAEGVELEAYQIKPINFNPSKKYPVLMFVYGGPGNQQVMNHWMGQNYLWYQHLASQGYAVVCVDNRGTGGRGAEFKKCTYAQLGKLEAQDQIASARYLSTLPWVDKDRIGIWGWSFGGYMTSLCMTLGADVFKAGIAVAPVTNWRFYDSIYTERYLKTPQENAAGYDDNSPVTHAAKLKGKYLLVHGTGDDNVHFQNAVAMQDALIRANRQFDSFYYPNRNHGIYGGVTRLHLYNKMTQFIQQNL